jgi:hypothetical protein
VTQGPPPPSSPSLWRQLQERATANPTVTAIAAYAITAVVAILAAYFKLFSQFIPYDDEGTVLITVRAFVHGDALYKDIWSVYGPFYYEIYGGFFKLTGIGVTTDASRTITMLVWVFTSLVFGLTAHRLSGRLSLGLTGMIAAFAALYVLANEPSHPQGLAILLLAILALVVVSGFRSPRLARCGAACGAVLAALLLTKVNLGVFAIAGVVVACALMIEPIHRIRWLRLVVVLAFLAMPVVVLERDLKEAWVREFALIEIISFASVLVASRTIWPRRGEDDGGTLSWALAAITGFVAAVVVIIGVILATGPSVTDVYDSVIKGAFGIRNVLEGIFSFPAGATLDGAVATVAAAALAAKLRLGGRDTVPSLWPGVLRAVVGSLILLAVAQIVPFADNPTSGDPDVVPLLLAWVAAIPPAGVVETPYRRLVRVLLPAVAVAETLQVYPVPGSQMGIAAAVFVPVGIVCLVDALAELRAWSAVRGGSALQGFGATIAVLVFAVPAVFALNSIVLPGLSNARAWHEQPKNKLAGAELLRLPPPQGEIFEQTVAMLQEAHCTTFVGLPNINSLYLWAGLESPPPQIPNGWPYALSESQQRQAVEELRASSRPCYLLNEELSPFYLHGEPAPSTPLVEYVTNDFKNSGKTAGSFQLFLPKPDATN